MAAICPFVRNCLMRLAWEFRLTYKMMWRDIPAAFIAGCAFSFAAANHCNCSPTDYIAVLPWVLFYFFLYLYSFNLCNQVAGVEEDRIDKPDRPIPSGLLTIQGAKKRWYVATVLYILAGVAIGNVWSSFLWIFTTLMLCYGGWDKHWFTKNCIPMPLGAFAQGWAGWSAVCGDLWMNEKHAVFLGVIAFFVGPMANLQDFRDVEGDSQSGRKTMPVQFGLWKSKVLMSIVFAIRAVVLYFAIWSQYMQPFTIFKAVYVFAEVLMHLYIIVRLPFLDHNYSDLHDTYHFSTKLYAISATNIIAAL